MKNFIPKQYTKEVVTIRIDSRKLEKIDDLANDNHISRSQFINQCIDFAIENMSKENLSK